MLVERPTEAVLHGRQRCRDVTFVLPDRIRIRDLSAGDTLVDLALRVLPTVPRRPHRPPRRPGTRAPSRRRHRAAVARPPAAAGELESGAGPTARGRVARVLRVGLTGGIGSGKSTAARRFAARGAVLVDSDVLAREVVAPGTDGLAEVVAAFGDGVLGRDGALDRPALAAVVFADPPARERLNAIVHPRVRDRTEQLAAAAAADAIVVQDVPLLVETASPAAFALVVVVHADAAVRVRRLVDARGMSAADARARIAAQADDDTRRAAADVWLDNTGRPRRWRPRSTRCGTGGSCPSRPTCGDRRPVLAPPGGPVAPDPGWAAAATGSPLVWPGPPGSPPARRHTSARPLCPGCPRSTSSTSSSPSTPAPTSRRSGPRSTPPGSPVWTSGPVRRAEWGHAGADPGCPVRVHGCAAGSPAWRAALLRRDWLRDDAVARARAPGWRCCAAQTGRRRRPWEEAAVTRMDDWAASSGWSASLDGVRTGHR